MLEYIRCFHMATGWNSSCAAPARGYFTYLGDPCIIFGHNFIDAGSHQESYTAYRWFTYKLYEH